MDLRRLKQTLPCTSSSTSIQPLRLRGRRRGWGGWGGGGGGGVISAATLFDTCTRLSQFFVRISNFFRENEISKICSTLKLFLKSVEKLEKSFQKKMVQRKLFFLETKQNRIILIRSKPDYPDPIKAEI